MSEEEEKNILEEEDEADEPKISLETAEDEESEDETLELAEEDIEEIEDAIETEELEDSEEEMVYEYPEDPEADTEVEIETIDDSEADELQTEDISDEKDAEIEFEMPEVPTEIDTTTAEIEAEVPEIPADDLKAEVVEDEIDIDEHGFEPEETQPTRRRRKRKRGLAFGLSILLGVILAIGIEVAFNIPIWLGGSGRPDLFYIELVLMLVVMMLPGLMTRSLQRGILGAFIIFIISFALPVVLTIFNIMPWLNPLAPLYASTDFSLDALDIFQQLFTALNELPIERIQKWVWIVDLIMMFALTIIVVLLGTALVKSVTKRKKKIGTWIGIPFLSIGLIVFGIFMPIIFSSTYGIVNASTAFLAGTARMQDAYGIFEESGLDLELSNVEIDEDLAEANYWLGISQENYAGLKNIGIINIAVLVSGQYGPLIEAGDQLALATLAMTNILYPLFDGISDLTSNLNNATENMANFGQESESSASAMILDSNTDTFSAQVDNVTELKVKLEAAIQGLESAKDSLNVVLDELTTTDVSGSFEEVKTTLDSLDTTKFPNAVGNVINEIRDKLNNFTGQIDGFSSFITFATENLDPTIKLLRTSYHSIAGNEQLKLNRFTEAKAEFQYAVDNVTAIGDISTYTPPPEIADIFAVEITEDFSSLLDDLVTLMVPLLNEELQYATTFETINTIGAAFAAETDLTFVNYGSLTDPRGTGNETEYYGAIAQTALDSFNTSLTNGDYGTGFNKIGISFRNILTSDFKPLVFGNITNYLSQAVWSFTQSCNDYSTQSFGTAITEITTADTIMTSDLIPLLAVDDPAYLQNYVNNWSSAISSIRTDMETYDTAGEFATGLSEIQLVILDLYTDIEEK